MVVEYESSGDDEEVGDDEETGEIELVLTDIKKKKREVFQGFKDAIIHHHTAGCF